MNYSIKSAVIIAVSCFLLLISWQEVYSGSSAADINKNGIVEMTDALYGLQVCAGSRIVSGVELSHVIRSLFILAGLTPQNHPLIFPGKIR